jgi:putative membrane protein
MWENAVVAYLHYLSFMVMYAALAVENQTFKQELSLPAAWKVAIADGIYGLSATTVLITGILRVFYFGKGSGFYASNPVFWSKVGLFFFIAFLSLYPTFSFLSWLKDLRRNQAPQVGRAKANWISNIIKVELVGFAIIPLLGALMARGIGSS